MDLVRLQKNIAALDVVDLAVEILDEMSVFIADLNREQMASGIRGDGSDITPEYTFVTKDIKDRKSGLASVIDHVTLYDTGAFHKSVVAQIFPDEVILDATDPKLSDLEEKYGKEILGLTEENQKKVRYKFLPMFEKRFYEQIYK